MSVTKTARGRAASKARWIQAGVTALSLSLLAGPVLADASKGATLPPSLNRGAVSFVWENDIFGGTDQNYSNGLVLDVVSRRGQHFPLTALMARLAPEIYQPADGNWRTGVTVGHEIYTPRDITLGSPTSTDPATALPDPNDRPYAGYAYVTASLYGVQPRRLDTLQVTLGIVGDGAGAEWTQTNFHQLIDGEDPKGWRFQIKTEPAVTLRFMRQQRSPTRRFALLDWDAGLHGGVSLGNVNTSANVGGGARFGRNFAGDFGPVRSQPALAGVAFHDTPQTFGWYVFADTGGRLVARDIFLDGNSFQDSRSVERENFVWDMQGGLALKLGPARLTFSYVQRSEQFENQDGVSRFGSGSITYQF